MKCPLCNKEINRVNIICECWLKGDLEGNNIISYGSVEEIMDTKLIECPKCSGNITNYVKEN